MDRANVFHSSPPSPLPTPRLPPFPLPFGGKKKKQQNHQPHTAKQAARLLKRKPGTPRCLRIPRRAGGGGAGGAPRPLWAGPGRHRGGPCAAPQAEFRRGEPTVHEEKARKNNTGERQCKNRVCSRRRSPRGGSARRRDVSGEAAARPGEADAPPPSALYPTKKQLQPNARCLLFLDGHGNPYGELPSLRSLHHPPAAGLALLQAAPHRGPDGAGTAGSMPPPPSSAGPGGSCCRPGLVRQDPSPPPRPPRGCPASGCCPRGALGRPPPPHRPYRGASRSHSEGTASPAAKCPCGPCEWALIVTATTVTFPHLFMFFAHFLFPQGFTVDGASFERSPREGRGPLGASPPFPGEPRALCGRRSPTKTSGVFLSLSRARLQGVLKPALTSKPRGCRRRRLYAGSYLVPAWLPPAGHSPRQPRGLRRPALGRHKPAGTRHPSLPGAGRCPQAGAWLLQV